MKIFISFIFFLTISIASSFAAPTPCNPSKIASLQNRAFIQLFLSRYPYNICKLIDLYDPNTKVVQCRANLKAVATGSSHQIVDCNASANNAGYEQSDQKCPCGWESVYVDGEGIINDYSYSRCPCDEPFDP